MGYAGWRGGLCENARIIYDYSRKPWNFGFGDNYWVKDLKYCTRKAVLTSSGLRPSRLCQECDADTAQEIFGRLFSDTPNVIHDATGTRLDERGRLTLEEAWDRVGDRHW
ncbi:hypothetical protein [Streptomyces sp. CAU 1734]|uniref:hypothetical protein n=1 Tax=Streptomyces sp. CAU 1734 TaxID=3140360 RepID=UPI0032600D88